MFIPVPAPGFGSRRARSRLVSLGQERKGSDMSSTSPGGQEPVGDEFGGPEPDEQGTDLLGGDDRR